MRGRSWALLAAVMLAGLGCIGLVIRSSSNETAGADGDGDLSSPYISATQILHHSFGSAERKSIAVEHPKAAKLKSIFKECGMNLLVVSNVYNT